MKKKIGLVDPIGCKAGMDCYDLGLMKGLTVLGRETYVFSNFSLFESPPFVYNFFQFHKSKLLSSICNYITGHIKAYWICKQKSINVIIVHIFANSLKELYEVALARILGIKVISIVHDIESFAKNDSIFIQQVIYKLSSRLIVHNQFSYQEISRKLSSAILKKVIILKHGGYIDFINSNMDKDEALKYWNLSKKRIYILFFGQIKQVKGLDILLKAMAEVNKDVHLIIAGKTWKDDFENYNNIINELNLRERVHCFIRHISDTERDSLFALSNALILPYKKIYQSGVLLMSMSYGLPLIASDLEPNKEIVINGENGILFVSENSHDLAEKINSFLKDSTWMEKVNINSLQTVSEKYSWNKIAEKYHQLLQEI